MSARFSKTPDVLARWARLPLVVGPHATTPERRTPIVNAIRSIIERSPAPRTRFVRRPALVVGILAAALVGLVLSFTHVMGVPIVARFPPSLRTSFATVSASALVPPAASVLPMIMPSSHFEADPSRPSRLQLLSGVEVEVGPETQLALPDAQLGISRREELRLNQGFVRVHVPKLPRGHFFGIRTPNTLVSVHGTTFSVEVTRSGPFASPRTRVVVTEGVVTVREGDRPIFLDAGMEWASSLEKLPEVIGPIRKIGTTNGIAPTSDKGASVPGALHDRDRALPGVPDWASSEPSDGGPKKRSEDETYLADQNRLFSQATQARDQGEGERAVRLFAEFTRRYPDAPLAQDAHVALFRVLVALGSPDAARAAQDYIARFPDGFAYEEARRLASEDRGERRGESRAR
ncbi:MAG: FecR domain-containing protein [Myxococcota bacterium]|nr:FecR domain-containing protein [Myxococcota bacterium]